MEPGVEPEIETPPEKPLYTAEELAGLTPTDIDLGKVDPSVRPTIEKAVRDYKELQADYSRKSMELSELKKTEEVYFKEANKNATFKDYLKDPLAVIGDINGEIAKLESIIPEDGAEEYRKARRTIAQWTGIKDEFSAKRLEISERSRQEEIAETKLFSELGASAQTLMAYAKELGYTEQDFKRMPKVREAVKKSYEITHAAESALHKEAKPNPHRAAAPGGPGGGSEKILDEDNPNLSTEERVSASRKRRYAAGYQ